tara:strand:+ start:2612 stop:3562 length:951 start_codon:yes stop_codon:yes gene_type:complete
MRKLNLIIGILIGLTVISCSNDDDTTEIVENKLEVSPVEKLISSNSIQGPIPVMNGTISFIPGENTPEDATYRMYFDTSENPSTVFDLKTTEKKYTNLRINQNYYWRVETISNNGKILASSPIWEFITGTNITVRTQKDLELLGSNKYSKIEGVLIIGDLIDVFGGPTAPSTDINDLSPLNELTQVIKLVINNNNSLKNLNGLSNVKIINKDLFIGQGQDLIGGNSSLEDISALSNIESLDGTLIIYNNNNLTSLTGLESLKSISQDLVIDSNMKLDNFCALKLLFDNTGLSGDYFIKDNGFNPTTTDLREGNCNK